MLGTVNVLCMNVCRATQTLDSIAQLHVVRILRVDRIVNQKLKEKKQAKTKVNLG